MHLQEHHGVSGGQDSISQLCCIMCFYRLTMELIVQLTKGLLVIYFSLKMKSFKEGLSLILRVPYIFHHCLSSQYLCLIIGDRIRFLRAKMNFLILAYGVEL